RFLKTKRKIFILISFIIGAVISPTPDMFSQTMIALPMILLYETSLFVLAKIMKR
ncbi:MAG: twin-arginine translocase subunit TatC, partial [Veillonella sp.]|nr:twin-arginine translocase subunit TatC [Veillonella sp.]